MQTQFELEIWLQSYEVMYQYWKPHKTTEFELFLCQYLKNNICDIRLIPLDHVTYLQSLPITTYLWCREPRQTATAALFYVTH